MKKAGILILIVGLAITVFTGLSFVTTEKVVDIGDLEINARRNHSLAWSPMIGVMVMAVGVGIYLLGKKRSMNI